MYSQRDIEDAVAAGALSAEQAASLRSYTAVTRGVPTVDEEYFRFLTGFNDIFVAVAAIFAFVAAGWAGSYIPPFVGGEGGPSPFIGLLVAAAAWGLAEFFVLRRRMGLPGIVLTLAFAYGLAFGLALVAGASMAGGMADIDAIRSGGLIMVVVALVAAAGTWLFWRRFQVPIAVAAAVGLLMLAVTALVGTLAMPDMEAMMAESGLGGYGEMESRMQSFWTIMQIVSLLLGLAAFAYAMWWDLRDRARLTVRADIAFWLHWLAAGMIVVALAGMIGLRGYLFSSGAAYGFIAVYVLLVLVALAISRRAMLLVALPYLYASLASLFGGPFGEGGGMPAATIIAVILLLLAAFWSRIRGALMGVLPAGLRAKLPAMDPPAAEEPAPETP